MCKFLYCCVYARHVSSRDRPCVYWQSCLVFCSTCIKSFVSCCTRSALLCNDVLVGKPTTFVTPTSVVHCFGTMALEDASARVAAVNIKLPPFWASDSQVWCAQVEAKFATRGITVQKMRFNYIVASLAPEFSTEVCDLVLSPPADRPYDKLKEQLIKRTAESEQKRLQLLLNTEVLGDRKPTQLLHRIQQLLGNKAGTIDDSLLREL